MALPDIALPDIDIATIILAISTIVLVGVTGYYAKQTKNTVKVLEKTAELSIRPHLKGTFQFMGPVAGNLLIKNVGNGPANKIELSYWIDGNDDTKRNWVKPLMMPNESEEFFIPKNKTENESSIGYFENNPTKIIIVGKYFDALEKEYPVNDSIDVTAYIKQFEHTNVRYKELTEEKISDTLKKISASLDKISRK